MGLARRSEDLAASEAAPAVIATIQAARAQSTRSLYNSKWNVFHDWFLTQFPDSDPFQAPIGEILNFLQSRVDRNLTYSTIKVWVHSLSACHVGYGGEPMSQHPLVPTFMKGVKRLRATPRRMFPFWDLPVVLDDLCKPPFGPLDLRICGSLASRRSLLWP